MSLLTACTSEEPKKEESKKEEVQVQEVSFKKEGVTYIDTNLVDNLLANVNITDKNKQEYSEPNSEWGFYLIDVRDQTSYQSGHINGAINIPYEQVKTSLDSFPDNKNERYILYARNPKDTAASDLALQLKKENYTNVSVYYEGIDEWETSHYVTVTDEYVKALLLQKNQEDLKQKPYVLIDSLPYAEYMKSHIPTAINAEDVLLEEKYIHLIPKTDDIDIILYCMGFECGKSHNAAKILIENGYKHVKVFAGGKLLWTSKGLPLATMTPNFDITQDLVSNKVNASDFIYTTESKKHLYIDARSAAEFTLGHVKQAINVPLDSYQDALPTIDRTKTIFVYSNKGERAKALVEKLEQEGFTNVYYLGDTITFHENGEFTLGN